MSEAFASLPTIYLTLDTDWCHEEVLQAALQLFREHDLPVTIFVTGAYAALSAREAGRWEIGLHPNCSEVTLAECEHRLAALQRLHPRAQGVATHAMVCSTPLLDLFRRCGFRYDRNLLCYRVAGMKPFVHHNGLLRLPVFWEDDIWLTVEAGARFSAAWLPAGPSRCIFNFHPIHLYLNTLTPAHYRAAKPLQHDPEQLARHVAGGYGARAFFLDLAAHIRRRQLATGLLQDFLTA
ncbi:MAG: hypothetical protein ONB48_20865 [candidate division KSB1 bacterium]|nr:hypothetical protein [candidate division KSB1 bacterium]MDZ7276431.1 hypothetical protein [candidate division KSB1 bacterium]MDZ7288101.1 hypothetical protein [candidate division KSB1 bacterium]MDZ7300202.1 hypothetical protein [candidate division KSB1 bacterium]MDZ7305773.1 hypothetical protein [candidate division KSB1 bacterium]